ncbi:MAG: hypothetical protein HXS54_03510 [Theionarchaea archaeon]|nr:hypothetical protein [Theionarchaea archaeon]
MRVIENAVVINEEDMVTLLQDMVLVTPNCTLVYQEKREWPVVKKEISPFGNESYHVIIPVEIGKNFISVYVLPVKEKRENPHKKVIEGRILILDGKDVCTFLELRGYEIPEYEMHFIFQEEGKPLVEKRKIKRFGERGYHVLVPKEIGKNFLSVFLIPCD